MTSLDTFMNKFGPRDQSYGPEVHELPSPKAAGGLDSFINRFTGFTESFYFYNNTVELRYNDDSHTYWLVEELGNLTEQDGVTRTVHIINAAEMLVPWAAKVTVAKMLRLIPTETVEGTLRIKPITFEEFTTIALEAKSAHKDKLEEAGDIGHLAHKCLEVSIKKAIASDAEKIVRQLLDLPADDRAVNAANAGKSWMDQHRVRWVETEAKIYSRKHRYAGTMDGLAYVSSCNDRACCPVPFENRLSLIDWKSSNHLKIEYLFQTASYKAAKMEEFPELKIEDIWILRLGKNEDEAGKFEPWHMGPEEFDICFQGFLACLELTRIVAQVTEHMKEQKKLIRAVRKEQREAAKALAKEQEKLTKALAKAEAKKLRDEEKARIKAEAKAKREADKLAKKKAKADIKEEVCTSVENIETTTAKADTTKDSKSDTTLLTDGIPKIPSPAQTSTAGEKYQPQIKQSTTTQEEKPETLCTISTEATDVDHRSSNTSNCRDW